MEAPAGRCLYPGCAQGVIKDVEASLARGGEDDFPLERIDEVRELFEVPAVPGDVGERGGGGLD